MPWINTVFMPESSESQYGGGGRNIEGIPLLCVSKSCLGSLGFLGRARPRPSRVSGFTNSRKAFLDAETKRYLR
ncbi:hypothetical protein ASC96_25190 [Rhizobium sp. Root1204]|nr:hypothetical protein ASC96_25190 [Rhizobium sp. Root1204]